MNCISLEDIIMGAVHTPNPTITEVMDVVIPEYIMMADLIGVLNTITTISIILGSHRPRCLQIRYKHHK